MPTPNILHAESFSYSFASTYMALLYPFNSITQVLSGWGRGSPAAGAMRGNSASEIGINVASSATAGQACAYNQGGNTGSSVIFKFYEGATLHVTIETDATGHIVAKLNGSSTIGSASVAVMPIGANGAGGPFTHIEAVVTVHDSTGAVQVKLDGISVLNLTGVDTKNGGTGVIDHCRINTGSVRVACDWVVHDGTGFVGDVRVGYFPANLAGTYTSGVASASTILSCVDDTDANGDTDYVSQDNTSLPKAISFNTANLPANAATVLAVVPITIIRKDDAGSNLGRLIVISGATESDGGADVSVPSAYTPLLRVLATDPNTSAAWTVSNVNAIEVGWRRTT